MNKTLLDYFADLPDPRVERTKLHKLEDILAITICAVVCGAEGWNEIKLFMDDVITNDDSQGMV